ncbi:cytochrome d ubiquinol oxidase subunit II [Streptosporangium sp. NPDC023615]|uniref:cytochrome d ubiquinol oxidase subunit II n=1 Tax=Streptosporangium sp. NPDC023615 TaxID=3154794 RepID=UPI003447BFED
MNLAVLWLALLGFLLAGYFVLGGADQGVQMLSSAARDERARTGLLACLGPFFFGNEVWLVGAVAVLIGAFPFLEGSLLPGLYPLFVALVAGLVLGKAAVQLRGRATGRWSRRVWDGCVAAGGAISAVGWGLVVGVLLAGVPMRDGRTFTLGWPMLLNPFVLSCGLAFGAVFAAHGLMFAWMRVPERIPVRPAPVLAVATAAVALAVVLGAGTGAVRPVNPAPVWALTGVTALALGAAWWAVRAGRAGRAFAATGVVAALPVPLLGVGNHPYVLLATEGPGMTVAEGAADEASLGILTAFGVVVLPLVLACQVWSWWAFRGRVDRGTPTYL